ncbi:MAG: hypothetical protein GXO47_10985 [Chlorobi bacterium]|nr:hypothetical protein [Chlorobiota bacterium]
MAVFSDFSPHSKKDSTNPEADPKVGTFSNCEDTEPVPIIRTSSNRGKFNKVQRTETIDRND